MGAMEGAEKRAHEFQLLHRYADVIKALPAKKKGEKLGFDDLAPLRQEPEGPITIYYAPFDFVNERAKVMLVGITPGPDQLNAALHTARRELQAGKPLTEVARKAKYAASFQGGMRRKVVEWLDGVGLQQCLGITTAASLFEEDWELLHPTSVIRSQLSALRNPTTGGLRNLTSPGYWRATWMGTSPTRCGGWPMP